MIKQEIVDLAELVCDDVTYFDVKFRRKGPFSTGLPCDFCGAPEALTEYVEMISAIGPNEKLISRRNRNFHKIAIALQRRAGHGVHTCSSRACARKEVLQRLGQEEFNRMESAGELDFLKNIG